MTFRKAIFWIHLICGIVTGIIVLIMSLTGVALTYQKQMTAWADKREYRVGEYGGSERLPASVLIDRFSRARPSARISGFSMSSDPAMPASITTVPNETTYINPNTGAILGAGSRGVRAFFRVMTDWHRWLALSGENRKFGRMVTGASNLIFLFLAVSGLYLWWPRRWARELLKAIGWFRTGLSGKARDSNWHFVFGFWCLVPLVLIIVSAVVISYPWASRLVFQFAGSQLSVPSGPPGKGGQRGGLPPGAGPRNTFPVTPGSDSASLNLEGLDKAIASVRKAMPAWQTISCQLPASGPSMAFTVDTSFGGQPQHRSTLTVSKATGAIVRLEEFSDLDPGLRARLWMRFVHTGEYYGFLGQTVAGIVSAAAVILVWTGVALSFRRYASWTKRRAEA